jgi:thiamine kinase-like enzyme
VPPEASAERFGTVRAVVAGRAHAVYHVATARGAELAVRLPHQPPAPDATATECTNLRAAATAGVAPRVHWCDLATGTIVTHWIAGRALSAADLNDPEVLRRVASLCRRLHSGVRMTNTVDVFAAQRRYRQQAAAARLAVPAGYDELGPLMGQVAGALGASAEGSAACHNDLVPANIIDDGTRLWLVDFEYAGNNDPCFELGYLWNEAGLRPERLDDLVSAYYGRPRPDRVARARLYALAADYAWTLWALLEATHNARGAEDVALSGWAAAAYARVRAALDNEKEFAALLAAAQRTS